MPKSSPLRLNCENEAETFHREAHDLIGHELFFQRRAWIRAVINDADAIAAVETIRWAMVALIGIVEHGDRHALDGFRAR